MTRRHRLSPWRWELAEVFSTDAFALVFQGSVIPSSGQEYFEGQVDKMSKSKGSLIHREKNDQHKTRGDWRGTRVGSLWKENTRRMREVLEAREPTKWAQEHAAADTGLEGGLGFGEVVAPPPSSLPPPKTSNEFGVWEAVEWEK